MKSAREQPGVQRDMVRLRETKGDMLCLYAQSSPTRRSYRAVLEVSPINLSLKAEDEHETAQHERRADRAGYLREKLEERAESEREAAEHDDA